MACTMSAILNSIPITAGAVAGRGAVAGGATTGFVDGDERELLERGKIVRT